MIINEASSWCVQAAELAEKSAERATRVAACEFLHATILWMVGTNARRPMSRDAAEDFAVKPTQFHGILQRLLPVALRLASGPEPVARQLCEPLIMSLVHWLTRAARRLNPKRLLASMKLCTSAIGT